MTSYPTHLHRKPVTFPPLSLFNDPTKTVSHLLASDPTLSPGRAAAALFPKPFFIRRLLRRFEIKHNLVTGREWTKAELDGVAERGVFPTRPSDLFLKVYADVLLCLTRDPLAGNVSPALLGTSGVIPLSIISVIPTIMKHYFECIVLADKEVMLQTNYWQPSDSVNTISSALRELSRRVGERKGPKVVVKIMWDRGSFKQLIHNHAAVTPETWIGLDLPAPSELPHLELEVVNFHRPLLGTFHQKCLIVDRRVALLNSNNIQDRPNLEMMVQLEGSIVDSLYDTMLISWHNQLRPPLPCLAQPPAPQTTHLFQHDNPSLAYINLAKASKAARQLLARQLAAKSGESTANPPDGSAPEQGKFAALVHNLVEQHRGTEQKSESAVKGATSIEEPTKVGVSETSPSAPIPRTQSRLAALSETLNAGAKTKVTATTSDETLADTFQPHFLHKAHEPFPIALVNRRPHGMPGHQDIRVPQDAAWLAGFRYAERKVFIQTPTLNAKPVVRAIIDACTRGIEVELWLDLGFNDAGESVPFQGGTNEQVTLYLYQQLKRVQKQAHLHVYWYTGKDQLRPLNAKSKSRNCHVKFMSVDGHLAILGNGNQDTQSWFHSQEANILVDSSEIVTNWLSLLHSNQSTFEYGRVDDDGIWRCPKTGEELAPPKNISCFTAIAAMI